MLNLPIDHDYHLHSHLSLCSDDPAQTPERMLAYAEQNGYHTICLTDHYWDTAVPGAESFDFYRIQNYEHIAAALPLPKSDKVRFLFGCETDMDKHFTLGIKKDTFALFDKVIIPTTHLHMTGFTIDPEDDASERRAELYTARLKALLSMDIPFEKVIIAHLSCSLMAPNRPVFEVLDRISDETLVDLMTAVAKCGAAVEINEEAFRYTPEELKRVVRPFRIAAACGCTMVLGSDAHHPNGLDGAKKNFEALLAAI